jgi:molybdopterin synthase sulfur carrier subunit
MSEMPVSLNLRYFALLREQRGLESEHMTTNAETARDLYDDIAQRFHFTLPPDKISVAINNQFCSLDEQLEEGDHIVLLPPVAGG